MIDFSEVPPSHSADVRIELVVRGRRFPVAKTGPDYLVLENAVDLDPCRGEVVMTIDGREHRWNVALTTGAVPFDPVVMTIPADRE